MPITVSHAKSDTIADMTGTITQYNSQGVSQTVLATNLVRPSDWNSNHAVTIALTGSELAPLFSFGSGLTSSTAAGGISVGLDTYHWFEPFQMFSTATSLITYPVNSWIVEGPYVLPFYMNSGQLMNLVSMDSSEFRNASAFSAATVGTVTRYMTLWDNWAIYRQGTGASTTRIESVWTGAISLLATQSIALGTANTSSGTLTNALTLSFPSQYDASGGVTYGSTSLSGSSAFGTSTAASTYINNLISAIIPFVSGRHAFMIPLATSISPGVFWAAYMWNSSSSSTGTPGGIGTGTGTLFGSIVSRVGAAMFALNNYVRIGASSGGGLTTNPLPWQGNLQTTATSATAVMATSDVVGLQNKVWFNLFNTTF